MKRRLLAIGALLAALLVWAPDQNVIDGRGPLACYGDVLRVRWTFVRARELNVQRTTDGSEVTMRVDLWGAPWSDVKLVDNHARVARAEPLDDRRFRFHMPQKSMTGEDLGLMQLVVSHWGRSGFYDIPGPAGTSCRAIASTPTPPGDQAAPAISSVKVHNRFAGFSRTLNSAVEGDRREIARILGMLEAVEWLQDPELRGLPIPVPKGEPQVTILRARGVVMVNARPARSQDLERYISEGR